MPSIKVYNLEGVETGSIDIPDSLASTTAKPELIYQVVRVAQARQRKVLAHAKDRSEVRGGGKKPWRQKGTGRARAGSIRSPLWRGGGVIFGPTKERNFALTIPRKMAKLALRAAVADKIQDDRLVVYENWPSEKPSAKAASGFLKKMNLGKKSNLWLIGPDENTAALSVRNLPPVTPLRLENINLLDLLRHETVIVSRAGVERIIKQLS